MFARLTGEYAALDDQTGLIDVHGVGYRVAMPARDMATLAPAAQVALHIHTAVSEHAIELYGFVAIPDLRLFEMLIKLPGVGPAAAMSILSAWPAARVGEVVLAGDARVLATIKRIGPKTAQRIVEELRVNKEFLAFQAQFTSAVAA